MRKPRDIRILVSRLCLLLFILAATFGAFIGGLWASLGMGGGVLLYVIVGGAEHRFPRPSRDVAIFVGVAIGLMALLNSSSVAPDISWHTWGRLVSIFVPLTLLTSPRVAQFCYHPKFVKSVSLAAALGALALGCELSLGAPLLKMIRGQHAPLTDYNRGLSYLVLLAFPLIAGILHEDRLGLSRKQRLLVVGAFIIILLFPAGLTESRAAKLALLLGLVTTVLAHLWPCLIRCCLQVLPFFLGGWPFMAQEIFRTHYEWLKHFPDSWRARMEIWDYMSYRIMERPWLGWGLGTSHLLPYRLPDADHYVFTLQPAAHPHNAFIEFWAELGLPGLALGIIFALLMLKKAAALPQDRQPFALGLWVAGLCLSLVAYDFWTDSLLSAFALTAIAFMMIQSSIGRISEETLEN